MANGFYGDSDAWDRISLPLLLIDPKLERFAKAKGLELKRNAKNWPDREFRWRDDLDRLIQIFLESEENLTWTMWITASEDRSGKQYSRSKTLAKAVRIEQLEKQLDELLDHGWDEVTSWVPGDLS